VDAERWGIRAGAGLWVLLFGGRRGAYKGGAEASCGWRGEDKLGEEVWFGGSEGDVPLLGLIGGSSGT